MISLSGTVKGLAASEGLSVFPLADEASNTFILQDMVRSDLAVGVSVSDLEIAQNKDNDEAMALLVNSRFERAVATLRKEMRA